MFLPPTPDGDAVKATAEPSADRSTSSTEPDAPTDTTSSDDHGGGPGSHPAAPTIAVTAVTPAPATRRTRVVTYYIA